MSKATLCFILSYNRIDTYRENHLIMWHNTHTSVYVQYFGLGHEAYRAKVHYYENNPDGIASLYFDDKLDVEIDYLLCLFEIGKYERYLEKVDPIVEIIIAENIFTYNGEDIFYTLLLKKAACYYQFGQYQKSQEILRQLIKIKPNDTTSFGFLTLCKRKMMRDSEQLVRAIAISLLLSSMSITVINILIIDPFFNAILSYFIWIRNFMTLMAILIIVVSEVYLRYSIYRDTGKFSSQWINKLFNL